MHKRLVILGFLLSGPFSGYQLHRLAATHGEFYSDLKKANLYYLLARMEQEGLVSVRMEGGARGPRRERLVYSITGAGRDEFESLLRQVLHDYQPVHTGVEVATILLDHLSPDEARGILEDRREIVEAHRSRAAVELGPVEPGTAGDHRLLMVDAELAWLDRTLTRMRAAASQGDRGKTEHSGR
jgi:DNA-binding PadR family transcriptional regulator